MMTIMTDTIMLIYITKNTFIKAPNLGNHVLKLTAEFTHGAYFIRQTISSERNKVLWQ
jgi:hypothetical protein